MKDGDDDKLIKENNKAMIGEVGALQHTCEGSPAFILPPFDSKDVEGEGLWTHRGRQ